MEVLKEGLHTYCVQRLIQNEYFLKIEYQILRYNHLERLLPVQLREQNGEKILLYKIPGKNTLITEAGTRGLSFLVCQELIRKSLDLLEEMDEYMLEVEHVSFRPEQIYIKEKEFYWMYLPDKNEDIQKEGEDLFQWLLSHINYEDTQTVHFVYHTFWMIRNRGFSKKTLEEALIYENERKTEEGRQSYEAYFANPQGMSGLKENTGKEEVFKQEEPGIEYPDQVFIPEKADNERYWPEEKEEKEKSRVRVHSRNREMIILLMAEVILAVLAASIGITAVIFFIMGIKNGFSETGIRYFIGIGIFLLIFLEGIWQVNRKRKAAGKKGGKKQKESRYAHNEETRVGSRGKSVPIHNYTWEEEEGTVVLGVRKDRMQPVVKCMQTGRIWPIFTLPFYVGSEAEINQLPVEDSTVSRQHAVILRGEQTGSYDVQDLKSTNGTWVNGKRIMWDRPMRLKNGDVIRFAAREYQFIISDSPGEFL